jgi:hypothetical protein
VGYTSFLRGPSQKAATAHFHIENHVESGILLDGVRSNQMEFGTLNKFWKFSNKIAGNKVNFFLEELKKFENIN